MKTYLRKGKSLEHGVMSEEKKCEKQPCDTKVREGGGEDASGTGAEIPLHSLEIMVKQVVPLQPVESYGAADTYAAAHGGPHASAGACALKQT